MIIKIKYQVTKKLYHEKNRDKLSQKQNDYRNKRDTDFKDLVKSYVELGNKLRASEKKFEINDSENI